MSVVFTDLPCDLREKILQYAINQQLPDEITLTKEFNSYVE